MRNEQYHILIVDDNEDILTMLKMMLEHNNYQISIQDNTNMISAHAHAGEECLSAGADFFLEKPFEMDNLLQTVAKASRNGKVKI